MSEPMNMDLLAEHAREKAKMPPAWKAFRWESFPRGLEPTLYVEVTGEIAPLYTKGHLAGKPNWNKGDKSTQKTVVITGEAHKAWLEAYARHTGNCPLCAGEGKTLARWSKANGAEWKHCPKCDGTGRADKAGPKVSLVSQIPPTLFDLVHSQKEKE